MEEGAFGKPADKLVLIVDDDESMLELMDHLVKREGFRTERASDGKEALRKVAALNPDLLLLDLMLPGMGGYEVLRQLQAEGSGGIPIIIITGRQMDRQAVEMFRLESNVKEFLPKPVRPAIVASHLHRLLRTTPPA